jgi:hypothetical protein
MEISELVRLGAWFEREVPPVRTAYANLLGLLQHNASQSDQRPLETELSRLVGALEAMDFGELSIQQIRLLERLGVRDSLGTEGVRFLGTAVMTANYDPATAVAKVQSVVTAIDNATNSLNTYRAAIDQLNLEPKDLETIPDRIIIRIGFENEASIRNITDWKDSGKEWYDIIRGLALAANESPENTNVIGTATGSIILILAGTVAVTSMLAVISKNITSVAKDVIGVGIERENLRQKKLLNTAIEAEFKKIEEKKRADALKTVMAALKDHLHKAVMGDAKVALEASVKKVLEFNEKGGVVDFVAPPDQDPEDEVDEAEGVGQQLFADVRQIIHEYQAEREALRLLTHQPGNDNSNEA